MKIEIVYALKEEQFLVTEDVLNGTSVGEALAQSEFLKSHPEINLDKIGIFSKLVKLNTLLKENDRIEIYRPLIADPKVKRREKAKAQRS